MRKKSEFSLNRISIICFRGIKRFFSFSLFFCIKKIHNFMRLSIYRRSRCSLFVAAAAATSTTTTTLALAYAAANAISECYKATQKFYFFGRNSFGACPIIIGLMRKRVRRWYIKSHIKMRWIETTKLNR